MMAETFPEFDESYKPTIQEAKHIPDVGNMKKVTPRYMVSKRVSDRAGIHNPASGPGAHARQPGAYLLPQP